VFVHLPLAFGSLSKVVRRCYSTCALKHVIGLLPNGFYALCGMGLSVPGLVFGDAGIDALDKVWRTNKTLNKIREEIPVKLEGVCAHCMMKNKCLGHCIAHNFFETQHLNSSYWFCEAAYKAGLFPESRLINFSEPLYAHKEEVMV
jgi:radical SAM protein with 4Fe4S-binding SPASM domain